MPLTATEWIQLREFQHAEGIVTTGELCTAYLRIAGEFSAGEVIAAVDKKFLADLLVMCRELPTEDDFCIFHHSPAQSRLHYEGLCKLHALAKKNDMWAEKAQPLVPADASRRG
jgi:hypothetical protein